MKYNEQLCQNAKAEYQSYIDGELQKSKDEIINNAYEISVYSELHYFLTDICNNELEEHVCKNLCTEGENVIKNLFNEFQETTHASINSGEDVYDFIINYSNMYYGNNDKSKNENEM